MSDIKTGLDLGRALVDALGLADKPWSRIVIVADVDDVARVYLRGFVGSHSIAGIVQAVKDVQVSEDGDVTVAPHNAADVTNFASPTDETGNTYAEYVRVSK